MELLSIFAGTARSAAVYRVSESLFSVNCYENGVCQNTFTQTNMMDANTLAEQWAIPPGTFNPTLLTE